MNYTISGEIAQSVRLDFAEGDSVWVSKGSLMAHTSGVSWRLRVPGGVGGAARRALSGEGLSLTFMEVSAPNQYALLAANEPGHIEVWNLADGPVITTRGAFMAAWGEDVDISVTVAKRAGAAFFGGAGLFLQRISGRGTVLVHGSGDFQEHNLAAGEKIMVSTGNLAAFASTIDYDIRGVGGCSKAFFGGEGFFMTHMTGPGRVLMQTLKRQYSSSSGS